METLEALLATKNKTEASKERRTSFMRAYIACVLYLWLFHGGERGIYFNSHTGLRWRFRSLERRMDTRSLRRNDDKTLPASHTVEVMFTLPPNFPHKGITQIPGVLMKQSESTRGVPLAGLAVKVTSNFFLIGLSSVEADRTRNIQLLKERGWFDIPLVYEDGRRAILAIEKGTPGERAFTRAFEAWGQ